MKWHIIKIFVVVLSTLVLTGCLQSLKRLTPFNKPVTLAPENKPTIVKAYLNLPADAIPYIAIPTNAQDGDKVFLSSAGIVSRATANTLAKYYPVVIAKNYQSYENNIAAAKTAGCTHLIQAEILTWQSTSARWREIPNRVVIKLANIELATAALVDSTTIYGQVAPSLNGPPKTLIQITRLITLNFDALYGANGRFQKKDQQFEYKKAEDAFATIEDIEPVATNKPVAENNGVETTVIPDIKLAIPAIISMIAKTPDAEAIDTDAIDSIPMMPTMDPAGSVIPQVYIPPTTVDNQAQPADAENDAEAEDMDALIRGTDRLIESTAPVSESDGWLRKSSDQVASRNWLDVIRTASASIARNPKSVNAYINRSLAYLKLRYFRHAERDANRVIKLQPNHYVALNNRGVARIELGRKEAGVEDYKQACKLGYALACTNFAEVVGWSVNVDDIKKVESFIDKSHHLFVKKQYDQVIDLSSQAITINPSHAVAYTNRCGAYIELRKIRKAIADCKKATMLNPDYALAYNNLGYIYERSYQLEEAMVQYEMSCYLQNFLGCSNLEKLRKKVLR